MYMQVCVCVYVLMSLCVYAYVHMLLCVVCVVCVFACIGVCGYVLYTHTRTHTHSHTLTHTHTHTHTHAHIVCTYLHVAFITVISTERWWKFLYGTIVLSLCLIICLVGAGTYVPTTLIEVVLFQY